MRQIQTAVHGLRRRRRIQDRESLWSSCDSRNLWIICRCFPFENRENLSELPRGSRQEATFPSITNMKNIGSLFQGRHSYRRGRSNWGSDPENGRGFLDIRRSDLCLLGLVSEASCNDSGTSPSDTYIWSPAVIWCEFTFKLISRVFPVALLWMEYWQLIEQLSGQYPNIWRGYHIIRRDLQSQIVNALECSSSNVDRLLWLR
jgi:hypothetical protein